MHTERFNKLRKDVLKGIFKVPTISSVWRTIVRNQLRQTDIRDLFDHYDFNYNIEERARSLRNEILSGSYQVSRPLIYKLEKKFGVCRHMIIPQPNDALILQVLVESISAQILKKQPSKNAFYSRDKHSMGKPHEAFEYGLSFREQWKQLQKKIYKFNQDKELIVVTDVSNYYDSINISELQKVFLSYVDASEVLVDLLFRVIEAISWQPDYLPYSSRGLPTSNLEAIRLLAHSFLFEVDDVLKQTTNDSFVRWMDDLVIGTDDRKKAVEVLSSISDMLKSRGLALNLAKTDIYDKEGAKYHFQIDENLYLDGIEKLGKSPANINFVTTELRKRFKSHLRSKGPKYWDKVAKRYITAFTKLESKKLLTIITEAYLNYPSLRANLLNYLARIGYSKNTALKVKEILNVLDTFDDISLYQISVLLTLWEIPTNEAGKAFVAEMDKRITTISFERKQPLYFYSCLWFKVKYSHPEELLDFIEKYKNYWLFDSFLRRQVTAILSRLLKFKASAAEPLLQVQLASGVANTVSVANQILLFSDIEALDIKLRWYLFPLKPQRPYPLSKFLVLCSVLNSRKIRKDPNIKKEVLKHVKDPFYRKWLEQQYNISG